MTATKGSTTKRRSSTDGSSFGGIMKPWRAKTSASQLAKVNPPSSVGAAIRFGLNWDIPVLGKLHFFFEKRRRA
jgi:hypothetical protein